MDISGWSGDACESIEFTTRYEKSTNHVEINDATRAALPINKTQQLLPGVNDLIRELNQLKEQLSSVKEERDEFKEEVTFLKYQLAYRAQVQNLQKEMNNKKQEETKVEKQAAKRQKSVRFSSSVFMEQDEVEDSVEEEEEEECGSKLSSSMDREMFKQLKDEKEELEDVLYDFYHDSKMAGNKERVLIGNIDSDPSESISSLICRVLVNYEKLNEEHRILAEEKAKLDEDKVQLCNSMGKLREQLHEAVDSNIEEIEDLNRENEELRSKVKTLEEKNGEMSASFVKSREETLNKVKSILEISKTSSMNKVMERLKCDISQAENALAEARSLIPKLEEEKGSKLKRVQSLPSSFRQESLETTKRGGLLRELKTCKDLQESQRKQIQKILEEKLDLEVKLSELKRQIVLLKAEKRANIKIKSRLVQTEDVSKAAVLESAGAEVTNETGDKLKNLSRKCKDLEKKLDEAKREKSTLEDEKTCLLMSLDANIEKKDALEEQLNALQAKTNETTREKRSVASTKPAFTQTDALHAGKGKPSLSETDGGFKASYKKGISEARIGIEKIRMQEQDKQIILLKRENETVKEKLKKAEEMSQTLQNCLKELTDEKHELLDSIEELNEEKAELQESRLKLEKKLIGTGREKFVADEVSDIRKKERKVGSDIEASKAKLTQLNLKVVEVLSLISSGETRTKETKIDSYEDVEDMIGSLLSTVENLKRTVSSFKTTFDKTKGDSLRVKEELKTSVRERNELQNRVKDLQNKINEMAKSLESNSKSQNSYESDIGRVKKDNVRLDIELEKIRQTNTILEKSLSETKKREVDFQRQLRDVRSKRDEQQQAVDRLSKQCSETTLLLTNTTKEVQQARITNEKLTKELESLREDLEGTVEDRDELLELLDRIVCENGSGEEKQNLGLKVERIRERSRSEEALTGVSGSPGDSGRPKSVEEKYLVAREAKVESFSPGDGELSCGAPVGEGKAQKNEKRLDELMEENHQLKEMVEKMINGQKKMELVLSSFSDANAEIQQDLEESIEHTEKIRAKRSEEVCGRDVVDYAAEYPTKLDENAELRELHKVMMRTNDALSTNLQRVQDEKSRTEQLRNSWQEVSQKNAVLQSNAERLTKDKAMLEQELTTLKEKRKHIEKQIEGIAKEKKDLQELLDESNGRVKDMRVQIGSLTEINQDLRETNEKLDQTSKETEKKWTKLNDDFDELEFENEALEKASKGIHQQLSELGLQKNAVEIELQESRKQIEWLKMEGESNLEKSQKLQNIVNANEKELKQLRDTANKFSKLKEKVGGVDTLESELDTLRKTIMQREKRIGELEKDVSRLKKEIENSQRFVKEISQENDSLRDSLSEWDREVRKIRQHVHEVSQDAELREHTKSVKKDTAQETNETLKSVKAFEAMQVEMDAINKHLKSLTNENKKLNSTVEELSAENKETKDRNIQLLTRYDMVSKDMEKKQLEIMKLEKDLKNIGVRAKTHTESRDKLDKEKTALQTNVGKFEQENAVLKSSLVSTLDQERLLDEKLRVLITSAKPKIRKAIVNEDPITRPKDIRDEELRMSSEAGGLVTMKPDLIRHSKEGKDELTSAKQRQLESEYLSIQNSGARTDAQELIKSVLKERASLKSHCQEIAQIMHKSESQSGELEKELEQAIKAKERMKDSLETTKTALEKSYRLKTELENGLQKKESELTQVTEQNNKLEKETAAVKEKCDKLQAVFRALIRVMNDKKGKIDGDKEGEKKGILQSDESGGSTSLIDYIKGIKTKYTGLMTEKENLEEKVKSLEKDIEVLKEKSSRSGSSGEPSQTKAVLEEKEKILNELLLSSSRDRRRFIEKLQELYEDFTQVKTKLKEVLQKQRDSSPGSVLVLEKVYQEFVETVTHTETFVQSVVHERRVTVVADAAPEKDPNLELAKENEELIGKINVIRASRRRETQNLKEELDKLSKEKEDSVKAIETKWKNELESATKEFEKTLKEKEQIVADVKHSTKEEVDQLKHEIRRISNEHETAQKALRNESRLAVEKLEEKNKILKAESEKMVKEKKESDFKMAEIKRKAVTEVKEKDRLAEAEISQVRANWAESERKLRTAGEEKREALRELERVKLEKSEKETSSSREMKKIKAALETAQRQSTEKEDAFNTERERLQRTITALELAIKNTDVTGLERTQSRITEFQRSLDELVKQNKLLENAKLISEKNLSAELEKLRYENTKLERDLQELREQRKVVVSTKEQPRRMEPNLSAPPGGRVKVLSTIKQPVVEKPRLVSPLESAPVSVPVPVESQRRVKVRESQAAVIHKGRVQEQVMPRGSDSRDPVFEELDAMFQQLNNASDWMDESRNATASVIQARPVQNRPSENISDVHPQRPQPEWEAARPFLLDPNRNIPATSRQDEPPLTATSGKPDVQAFPTRMAYTREEEVNSRHTYPIGKLQTVQAKNTLKSSEIKATRVQNIGRRPVEERHLPPDRKPNQSVKTRQARRPSVGSDDVFLSESSEGIPTLLTHGSKHGEFWKSRSLTDLTDVSEEKKTEKQSSHHHSQKNKQKLPKSFSGPRKVETSKRHDAQGRGSLGKGDKNAKAKTITPLKGMEYVIFQHQI